MQRVSASFSSRPSSAKTWRSCLVTSSSRMRMARTTPLWITRRLVRSRSRVSTHTALGRGLANQLGVADAGVVRGVVAQGTQPAREAPDVAVGQESRLHHRHLRIVPVATSEDLMTRLRTEASGCYSWSNGPGDRYAPHSHGYEKVLYCVDGSITFVLEAHGPPPRAEGRRPHGAARRNRPLGGGRASRLHLHRRPRARFGRNMGLR